MKEIVNWLCLIRGKCNSATNTNTWLWCKWYVYWLSNANCGLMVQKVSTSLRCLGKVLASDAPSPSWYCGSPAINQKLQKNRRMTTEKPQMNLRRTMDFRLLLPNSEHEFVLVKVNMKKLKSKMSAQRYRYTAVTSISVWSICWPTKSFSRRSEPRIRRSKIQPPLQ